MLDDDQVVEEPLVPGSVVEGWLVEELVVDVLVDWELVDGRVVVGPVVSGSVAVVGCVVGVTDDEVSGSVDDVPPVLGESVVAVTRVEVEVSRSGRVVESTSPPV